MNARPLDVVDFIARLADAWDGRGATAFTPYAEHEVLCTIAKVDLVYAHDQWNALPQDARRQLLFAARRAVELGRACAWVFGEGRGA